MQWQSRLSYIMYGVNAQRRISRPVMNVAEKDLARAGLFTVFLQPTGTIKRLL